MVNEETTEQNNYLKFLFGGLASMGATFVVQPLDLLKTRMQINYSGRKYGSMIANLAKIIRNEGPLSLYSGLSAGLLKQASYGTVRLGIYTSLCDTLERRQINVNLANRILIGMTAGVVGATCCIPFEVVVIRMMTDPQLPIEQRRNYKNAIDGMIKIARKEGVSTLWCGYISTVSRAAIANAAQFSSYSQCKRYFKTKFNMEEGTLLYFCASMTAGIIGAYASIPLDMAKTRIQNMENTNFKREYSGTMDVLIKTVKNEGFFSLWRGFIPYYARAGLNTVLVFVFFEELTNFYNKYTSGTFGGSSGL